MGVLPYRLWRLVLVFALAGLAGAQDSVAPGGPKDVEESAQLKQELREHEARIRELEEKLAALSGKQETPDPGSTGPSALPPEAAAPAPDEHEHSLQLPGGATRAQDSWLCRFQLGSWLRRESVDLSFAGACP